jgi:PIN domain nuclease of toxin-antitoxin system
MNYLLDTHVFIWMDSEPLQLSPTVETILKNKSNAVFLSVVSAWEIQIKTQIGKLALSMPVEAVIQEQQKNNGLQILPVTLAHALKVGELLLHHKDPFDRLLVAQAIVEACTLITKEPVLSEYDVKVIW